MFLYVKQFKYSILSKNNLSKALIRNIKKSKLVYGHEQYGNRNIVYVKKAGGNDIKKCAYRLKKHPNWCMSIKSGLFCFFVLIFRNDNGHKFLVCAVILPTMAFLPPTFIYLKISPINQKNTSKTLTNGP